MYVLPPKVGGGLDGERCRLFLAPTTSFLPHREQATPKRRPSWAPTDGSTKSCCCRSVATTVSCVLRGLRGARGVLMLRCFSRRYADVVCDHQGGVLLRSHGGLHEARLLLEGVTSCTARCMMHLVVAAASVPRLRFRRAPSLYHIHRHQVHATRARCSYGRQTARRHMAELRCRGRCPAVPVPKNCHRHCRAVR